MGINDAPKEVRDRIVNEQTKAHQVQVLLAIQKVIKLLAERAVAHDMSKLVPPEAPLFNELGPRLRATTYGTDEYHEMLAKLKPALDHHYANNRHHPEHFDNGVDGMNIVDLIEMFCDWKAATLRHEDGDLVQSINHNADRFELSDQLKGILMNSVSLFDKKEGE